MYEGFYPLRHDWLKYVIAMIAGLATVAIIQQADAQNHDKNRLRSVVLEPTPAAQPLSIESETVEIETVLTTIERTDVNFGSFQLPGSVRQIGSISKTKKATLVVASEPPRAAYAYTPGFETVNLLPVDATTFLLEAKPGRYLLVFDMENGSQIRPVVVESSGPDTSELATLAVELAEKMEDPETVPLIASALGGAAYNVTQSDLTLAQGYEIVQGAITSALRRRPRGPSRGKPWVDGFRRPLDAAILAAEIETIEDFAETIRAISEALKESSSRKAPSSSQSDSVRSLKDSPIVPLSATFPPAWEPPPGPHFVGQKYKGRVVVRECLIGGSCRAVWKAEK